MRASTTSGSKFRSRGGKFRWSILYQNVIRADDMVLEVDLLALDKPDDVKKLRSGEYSIATGQQTSDKPQDWIKEAVNRSGISGWISDINAAQAKVFAGKTDLFRLIGSDRPLSRCAQRSALSSFLGPTYGRLERLLGPLYSLSQGTWSANDTDAIRRWHGFRTTSLYGVCSTRWRGNDCVVFGTLSLRA